MLDEPGGVQAEAFRMLRTNLDFVNLERGARTILVTSSIEEEGKSTTAANLAIAAARAGKRVVLVDLDLRRPYLHRFFAVEASPGATDVALGNIALDEALIPVAIPDQPRNRRRRDTDRSVKAIMHVLPAGSPTTDASDVIGSRALGDMLDRLSELADIVLVDAPPILRVGDAMTLSARVDAMLLVARLNVVRRPMLSELERLLGSARADVIGYVATGAEEDEGYRYAEGYAHYGSRGRRGEHVR
jgi:non-specific protein-tyrosine kinase